MWKEDNRYNKDERGENQCNGVKQGDGRWLSNRRELVVDKDIEQKHEYCNGEAIIMGDGKR